MSGSDRRGRGVRPSSWKGIPCGRPLVWCRPAVWPTNASDTSASRLVSSGLECSSEFSPRARLVYPALGMASGGRREPEYGPAWLSWSPHLVRGSAGPRCWWQYCRGAENQLRKDMAAAEIPRPLDSRRSPCGISQ